MFSHYKSIRWGLLTAILMFIFSHMSCSVYNPVDSDSHSDQSYSAMASFSYTLSATGISDFALKGINGNVEIIGIDETDSVKIWGKRLVRSGSYEDAEYHLEQLSVHVETYDHEIGVKTKQPNESNGRSYEVEYHVRLPKSLKIIMENVNGQVAIANMENEIQTALVNGNIHVDTKKGGCQTSVVNGNIYGEVSLLDREQCSLNSVNGNITLVLPNTSSCRIEASVVNGNIVLTDLDIHNLNTSKTSVSGVVGEGSAGVRVQTINGNVELIGE
jgi:uncharacterized secreted protein with C-terminal beta-propeller domain